MLTDEYIKRVYDQVVARDGDQPEFLQAVREVFETLQPVVEKHPEYEKAGVLERIVEPERTIKFRVAWVDDEGKVQVNRGLDLPAVTASSSTPPLARTRAACASTRP